MNSGDLSALADATAAATGGAVAVMDPHGYVVAYSSLPGQQTDEVRRDGILGKRVPDKYLVHHQDPAFRASSAVHVVDLEGTLPRLAVAVGDTSGHLGSIWVIMARQSIDPPDRSAVAAMARAAAAAAPLLRARVSPRRDGSDEVRKLLTDDTLTPSDRGFVVVAVESAHHTVESLIGLLDLTMTRGPHSGCAVIDGVVYVLRTVDGLHASTEALVAEAEEVRQRACATVGISIAMGISDVRSRPVDARVRARRVLDVVAGEGRTATFEQVEVKLLLSDARSALVNVPLAIPAVEEMLVHDSREGTAYGATVLALLENESNVAVASASLYLHANTFRYRIRRTKELFGLDLDNADTRLLVWMALRFTG
ncbi:PucR family transcriptional regulator [Rhodococcus sp. NPDC057297]|uniref:PucR family transcriptional regulator n=1 Tax=Rhodococcus sp. NPDC057297 TaxID=3346090 RepID=UPI00363076FD